MEILAVTCFSSRSGGMLTIDTEQAAVVIEQSIQYTVKKPVMTSRRCGLLSATKSNPAASSCCPPRDRGRAATNAAKTATTKESTSFESTLSDDEKPNPLMSSRDRTYIVSDGNSSGPRMLEKDSCGSSAGLPPSATTTTTTTTASSVAATKPSPDCNDRKPTSSRNNKIPRMLMDLAIGIDTGIPTYVAPVTGQGDSGGTCRQLRQRPPNNHDDGINKRDRTTMTPATARAKNYQANKSVTSGKKRALEEVDQQTANIPTTIQRETAKKKKKKKLANTTTTKMAGTTPRRTNSAVTATKGVGKEPTERGIAKNHLDTARTTDNCYGFPSSRTRSKRVDGAAEQKQATNRGNDANETTSRREVIEKAGSTDTITARAKAATKKLGMVHGQPSTVDNGTPLRGCARSERMIRLRATFDGANTTSRSENNIRASASSAAQSKKKNRSGTPSTNTGRQPGTTRIIIIFDGAVARFSSKRADFEQVQLVATKPEARAPESTSAARRNGRGGEFPPSTTGRSCSSKPDDERKEEGIAVDPRTGEMHSSTTHRFAETTNYDQINVHPDPIPTYEAWSAWWYAMPYSWVAENSHFLPIPPEIPVTEAVNDDNEQSSTAHKPNDSASMSATKQNSSSVPRQVTPNPDANDLFPFPALDVPPCYDRWEYSGSSCRIENAADVDDGVLPYTFEAE